jgi:hypothetical protein
MLTAAELKYNALVKEVFQAILKPLGYKKKGNNFYLQGEHIGKLISLQKSSLYAKDHIRFTINIGLFSGLLWDAYYTYPNKRLPSYPTIGECAIRKRIGGLLRTADSWFEFTAATDLDALLQQQQSMLTHYILPYLNTITTEGDIHKESKRCLPSEVYIRS